MCILGGPPRFFYINSVNNLHFNSDLVIQENHFNVTKGTARDKLTNETYNVEHYRSGT